jgi:formylglycine-generating enzyme required for sulfatase activity
VTTLAAGVIGGCATTPAESQPASRPEAAPQPRTAARPTTSAATPTPADPALAPFTQAVPGTALELEMRPVPAGRDDDGRPVAAFWIARTETTWDLYDVFVFKLDGAGEGGGDADAITRPSKPYIAMDRGFGHNGMPALSMSYLGATTYCEWLSRKTGRRYRLPTEAEWRHACRAGAVEPARIDDHAWHESNADFRTHPVASKAPDALGVHDLHGNASEWCTGNDGEAVTLGGSYRDPPSAVGLAGRALPVPAWNASDPQFPKSRWWLADAGFVGFRVICEVDDTTGD